MRTRWTVPVLILLALACLLARPARAQRREYLTNEEQEKVRDAQEPNERVKLFLKFASERFRRFRELLSNPGVQDKQYASRAEALNDLLGGFTACVDDGADALQLGHEHGVVVLKGAQEMLKAVPVYLKTLEELQKNTGPDTPAFATTLDDSIEALHDAINEAKKIVADQTPARRGKEKR